MPHPPKKKHLPKFKANKKYYQVKLNENKKCCEATRWKCIYLTSSTKRFMVLVYVKYNKTFLY